MDKQEIIEKIIQKKEFSQLPLKDVELALEKFDKPRNADYQKVKLTRQFLRKIFSGFSSRKVFHKRDENVEWFLMKHKSTKERFPFYEEVYERCFKHFPKSFSVIDLGAGINGLSYDYMINALALLHHPTQDKVNEKMMFGASFVSRGVNNKLPEYKINYVGVEAVGQFVELMNFYFEKEKIKGRLSQVQSDSSKLGQAKAIHESLFELDKIVKIIKQTKEKKIIFLFKVIDSLEIMERDYSKKLLLGITPLADRVVVSFATRSLGARKKFGAQRSWILRFISENFKVLDDFELGGERYLVFERK